MEQLVKSLLRTVDDIMEQLAKSLPGALDDIIEQFLEVITWCCG